MTSVPSLLRKATHASNPDSAISSPKTVSQVQDNCSTLFVEKEGDPRLSTSDSFPSSLKTASSESCNTTADNSTLFVMQTHLESRGVYRIWNGGFPNQGGLEILKCGVSADSLQRAYGGDGDKGVSRDGSDPDECTSATASHRANGARCGVAG